MKNAYIILITVAIVFLIYRVYIADGNSDTISRAEFEETHNRLKQQIDSILRECDTLKNELKIVRANTDTLKAGQVAIFTTMQENKNKTFWDYLNF